MPAPVLLPDLGPLFAALRADGRRVIGPTVVDGAVVLAELDGPGRLPYGWRTDVAPGRYRLRRHDAPAAFRHTAGPQSWKRFLHPPREPMWRAERTDDGFTVAVDDDPPPRLALLGVRPCDVRAVRELDRVLGSGQRYAARRAATMILAVNCTEPGAACFCAGTGTGPAAADGYDVVLTERADGSCLAASGSRAGTALLERTGAATAPAAVVAECEAALADAAGRMGRVLPPVDLRDLLIQRRDDPHWADLARRCLACGNCTMVCPTCFCATVEDVTDLSGDHAERWQRWDSCFDVDFSFLHGGAVRVSVAGRYRHWISHKFGTWAEQFGGSGCVGCGRCVVWCPAGIDVTAELDALASAAHGHVAGEPDPEHRP